MAQHRDGSPPAVRCILCEIHEETDTTGPLGCKDGVSAHYNCLVYSSGIYCKNSPSFDDLFGFDVDDVKTEYNRGKKLKCHYCRKRGATVGCEMKICKRSYHYPCAMVDQAKCVKKKKGLFMLYCPKHDQDRSSLANEPHCSTPDSTSNAAKRSILDDSHGETLLGGLQVALTRLDVDAQPLPPENSRSDSDILSRGKKRKIAILDSDSDSDEVYVEDIVPQNENESTAESDDERNREDTTPGVISVSADADETDIDEMETSQSLLEPEYQHENVTISFITDSGPFSIDSENSVGTSSPSDLPGPTTTAAHSVVNSHESPSTPERAATVHTPTTPPVISPPVPDCPSIDSPPLGGNGVAEPLESDNRSSPTTPSCEEPNHDEQAQQSAHPTPQNTPPLNTQHELPKNHVPPRDCPLDLTAPPGDLIESPRSTEGRVEASVSETSAALFWRRCNEVSCTEAIFSELTRQISSLAEKVQAQHATQQDYAVSLRILEASGKLPAIFQQLEQDFEEQERKLQRKKAALRDARALLNHPK